MLAHSLRMRAAPGIRPTPPPRHRASCTRSSRLAPVEELAPGLHRWTARHPAWEPGGEPGSPDDWPPEVGCVAYEGPDALVLVDPLVDGWEALDAIVERHGKPVVVLTTMRF